MMLYIVGYIEGYYALRYASHAILQICRIVYRPAFPKKVTLDDEGNSHIIKNTSQPLIRNI